MTSVRIQHVAVITGLLFVTVCGADDAKPPALSAPPPKTVPLYLNSYLPAAMQVLAHLTNQMKYEREASDTMTSSSTSTTSTTTRRPSTTTTSSTVEDSTPVSSTTQSPGDETTPLHAPANFAPLLPRPHRTNIHSGVLTDPEPDSLVPPIASPNLYQSSMLLPEYQAINQNQPQYGQNFDKLYDQQDQPNFPAFMVPVSGYYEPKTNPRPVFLPGNFAPLNSESFEYPSWFTKARTGDSFDSYNPSGEYPALGSLPVQNENNFKLNPLEANNDEFTEENLQYLAPTVREILEGFHAVKQVPVQAKNNPTAYYQSIEDLYDNPNDKKTVGDWLRARKAAVTQTYIQLLLLYDLLSRDAKTQKLNNYHGYTPELQKDLDEASMGTAAEQLKVVLDRMVARGDCKYDFANNRAKEIVIELGKPESRTSMEVRYLSPLRFT